MAPTKKHKPRKPSRFDRRIMFYAGPIIIVTIIAVILQLYVFQSWYIDEDSQIASLSNRLTTDLAAAIKPFHGDSFNLKQIFDDNRPFWGTLNSGHYFGLKLSTSEPIETSLLWFANELNQEGGLNIRHLCDQNHDLYSYAWTRHNFHDFGEQVIEDRIGYRLKTSYLKRNRADLSWQARIEVEKLEETAKPISVIQYIYTDNSEDEISLDQTSDVEDSFAVDGYSRVLNKFKFEIQLDSNTDLLYKSRHSGFIEKKNAIGPYLQSQMISTHRNGTRLYVLSNQNRHSDKRERHNIIAYQIVLEDSATLILSFTSQDSTGTKPNYESELSNRRSEFDRKFRDLFPIQVRGNLTQQSVDKLAKISLSNMIGSVGHFYGHSIISSSSNPGRIARYGPIQLLTGVPSRSFFPRGFLWDEGFHNLLISKWDPELSSKIIKSWFDIMNSNGWIPREVILGAEAMRRVPNEFIIQRIDNANPPSMFIVLERMLDDGILEESTLRSIYPRLKAWYRWFNITQSGSRLGTFRWRGRDELSINMLNPKTLTSGLDDFPRASHPSPDEYHIDLLCWMALAARTLSKFAAHVGDTEFGSAISMEAERLSDNKLLEMTHWSDQHKMYCDFGHNTEKAELVRVTKTRRSSINSEDYETYQVLERHSSGNPVFGCVPEFGYVGLFPMLLKVLEAKSEKLGIILSRMRDENELWSDYGIRSLSKSSRYYNKYNTEHDKPYWRGPIWLNINYLILSSLKHYSELDGPYQAKCAEIFLELKQNLVNNVHSEFVRTNYIWENYDDRTGRGQGSHPFTGWSSLILLIMSS